MNLKHEIRIVKLFFNHFHVFIFVKKIAFKLINDKINIIVKLVWLKKLNLLINLRNLKGNYENFSCRC
ncbi:hypothetical protein DP067_02985 [Mycoplasmopsis anatis]|uniref:Uncharacterized protein n=1 Tax=Mycoplasmopsis anatis 1340 TaxID=1034808 RepID=F9QEE8_9BACT|nr:hypothetical protein DP067_02985 [Mycoplasmopsis anatis]EGS28875.1 hypothetical protein GIG_03819 [Mycoplasmopsis anatis 1340]